MSGLNMTLLARATSGEVMEMILETMRDGIDSGDGLDGRVLEMAGDILAIDGALYTDGECLDLLGLLVDTWRAIDLNGGE